MHKQQEKHAMLSSKNRKVSVNALVENSITHYDYDVKHGRLIFNESYGKKPSDLPRTIKISSNRFNQFFEYSQNIESEKWNSNVEKKALK